MDSWCDKVMRGTWLLIVLASMARPATGQDKYVIDTLAVLDDPLYNQWGSILPASLTQSQRREQIKEYISLVVRQANSRLQTLSNDDASSWNISLSVTSFVFDNPLASLASGASTAIPLDPVLGVFKTWVISKGYNTQYDYIVLFTGYDLKAGTDLPYEIKGIANIGTICNPDGTSIAVVEDHGGFQSAHFVAHEMGHSLGADHDGVKLSQDCPDADRYIMAINVSDVTSQNVRNPWYFSSCSKSVIGNHLVQSVLVNYPSCLNNAGTPSTEYADTAGLLPGQVYDFHQQCKQLYGPQSQMCWGGNFGQPEDICTAMYCLDPSLSSQGGAKCLETRAAEGTSCGDGKICQAGVCTSTESSPSNIGDCYFGDQTVTFSGGLKCDNYIPTNIRGCYGSDIKSTCCESCKQAKRQSQACPYGDRITGCSQDICQHVEADGTRYDVDCCGTCQYDVYTECADVDSIDGMNCDARITLNGWQGCYNTTVAYFCCKSCQDLRKNITGCEYGDQTTDTSCQSLAVDEASCQQHSRQCCGTCRALSADHAWVSTMSLPLSLLGVIMSRVLAQIIL